MKTSIKLRFITLSLSMVCLWAHAETHLVTQKSKTFSTKTMRIKVGDSVDFRNDDTVYHNIFSLSDPTSFDLGSYGPGEKKNVVFDKPGTIEVECAVHKDMKMTIEVAK